MDYFYNTEEKRNAVYKEAEEWIGTPHKQRCMVKRKGVDCIYLVVGIHLNVGVPVNLARLPEYNSDWHLHSSREFLIENLKKRMKVTQVFEKDFMDGDILLYRFGKASSHAGVFCRGRVYHSVTGLKVTRSVLQDRTWYHRLTHVYRVLS